MIYKPDHGKLLAVQLAIYSHVPPYIYHAYAVILPTVTYMQVGKITAYHKQVSNSKLKYIIMKNEENILSMIS